MAGFFYPPAGSDADVGVAVAPGGLLSAETGFATLDRFGRERRPCFFAFDFSLVRSRVLPLADVDPASLLFDMRGKGNCAGVFCPEAVVRCSVGGQEGKLGDGLGDGQARLFPGTPGPILRDIRPPAYREYRQAFQLARQAFVAGDSYLLNLTASSRVEVGRPLRDLFWLARAPYRLWMDGCLVFSPEAFVRIAGTRISTYPMKGSLRCPRAGVVAGRQRLLDDPKEQAEHVTVVDLLRNDLGKVARRVEVPRFRYLEEIGLGPEVLLQTSSEIRGELEEGWHSGLGTIMRELLPAGSVSGAPKLSTCRHIERAEGLLGHRRGWYCGVFGIYDGQSVESAVMIRFLEDRGGGQARFFSGGGLTFDSRPQAEYRELVQKVAFPAQPDLFETIRVEDGKLVRPEWHARRMALTACRAWAGGAASAGALPDLDLATADAETVRECLAMIEGAFGEARQRGPVSLAGRCRFRLDYNPLGPVRAEIHAYVIRRPVCLYLVDAGDLRYDCKYADRSGLEALRAAVAESLAELPAEGSAECPPGDWDIMLCRDGRLLETSYAALVCELSVAARGSVGAPGLVCPRSPLLVSTRLAAGRTEPGMLAAVRPMDIGVTDLPDVARIFLVNAMLDLEDGVEIGEIRRADEPGLLVWRRCNSFQGKT